jgi:hypothetical protein
MTEDVGSGLHQSWAFAAVANHYADGFEDRLCKGVKFLKSLVADKTNNHFQVQRVDKGTNIFRIKISMV